MFKLNHSFKDKPNLYNTRHHEVQKKSFLILDPAWRRRKIKRRLRRQKLHRIRWLLPASKTLELSQPHHRLEPDPHCALGQVGQPHVQGGQPERGRLVSSVTRLGDFLVTNFSTKLDQILGDFWSYFEKGHILCKNCCGYFLGNFEGKFGYFLFQHMVALLMSHHISGPGQGDQPDYDGKKNHSNQSKMV